MVVVTLGAEVVTVENEGQRLSFFFFFWNLSGTENEGV